MCHYLCQNRGPKETRQAATPWGSGGRCPGWRNCRAACRVSCDDSPPVDCMSVATMTRLWKLCQGLIADPAPCGPALADPPRPEGSTCRCGPEKACTKLRTWGIADHATSK